MQRGMRTSRVPPVSAHATNLCASSFSSFSQAGESDKRLDTRLAAEAAAFAALDPQAAATQMPKMQVGGAGLAGEGCWLRLVWGAACMRLFGSALLCCAAPCQPLLPAALNT